MQYRVLASGSKGNCTVIEDVMIDCGIPFNKLKESLYGVRYLLLTHIHGDHIRPKTLEQIKQQFPRVKVIGNYEVHYKYGVDIISNHGFPVETEHYSFEPFECTHDVETQGFVWETNGLRVIYATDTSDMDHAPGGKYDVFFVESNHCEKKLEQVNGQAKAGYNPYLSGKRHLSTQACKSFYYMQRRSRESELIELHRSERFY